MSPDSPVPAPAGARYTIPARRHRVEQSIERSRFICTIGHAASVEDAQLFLSDVSVEFADATHNCWAWVVGPAGSTERIGMSDDGEPHGTAGRPMLTVLLHGGVGEIVAVVTRYYGGVKLGTGGLARAYGGTVQLALETLPRVERVELVTVVISVDYASISVLHQMLPLFEAVVLSQEYDVGVRFRVRVPLDRLPELRAAVLDATRGKAQFGDDAV